MKCFLLLWDTWTRLQVNHSKRLQVKNTKHFLAAFVFCVNHVCDDPTFRALKTLGVYKSNRSPRSSVTPIWTSCHCAATRWEAPCDEASPVTGKSGYAMARLRPSAGEDVLSSQCGVPQGCKCVPPLIIVQRISNRKQIEIDKEIQVDLQQETDFIFSLLFVLPHNQKKEHQWRMLYYVALQASRRESDYWI